MSRGVIFSCGRAATPSRSNCAATCAEFFRYYAGWCTKVNGTAHEVQMTGGVSGVYADMHTYTLKEPYGVVGLIFPWNGPVFNACAKLAPALAAGCGSVVKPAEETPLSAVLLDKIVAEAGVPEGVVNLVTGLGHTAGEALTAHPDVEKIAFTGSTEVGKRIVEASAGNLKKVMLELGGKSPVLIYDDALRAGTGSIGADISFTQPCSPTSIPKRTCISRRSSGPWSRSCRSTTTTKP